MTIHTKAKIKLDRLDGIYAIAQLSHLDRIPDWVDGDGFVNISRTDDELSLVCLEQRVPHDVTIDRGWICFKFVGPFAFDQAGVLLSVIQPLSENGIGVFAVSTFNGDVLLLKADDVPSAEMLLCKAGHGFT